MAAQIIPFPRQQDPAAVDLARLRREYTDYLSNKQAEIDEQKIARRYYHGDQWTAREIAALKKRKQPVVTSNRIVRKIDAVVGLVERLRQDPKAAPRTPIHEQGAELATAVLRFVLDDNEWKGKSPECARDCAIEGIGGIEYDLAPGDQGDMDLEIHIVDPDTFFYDPRSFRQGFSDARFLGVAKWIDIDALKELVSGMDEEIDNLASAPGSSDLTTDADREKTWLNMAAKTVRLVDHWYIQNGEWYWCLHVGTLELKSGKSPFIDEKGKTFPRYRMFSASVDHDGDRYGFVRNLKSPQDEINHRRSKALHILNNKRIVIKGPVTGDIEKVRTEWARPDGVVVLAPGADAILDNQNADFAGQLEFLNESKAEIENFGPNPALIGQGLEDSSGRAISLLQQAGIAELGPYLLSYKQWKIRVYRDIWNIIQRSWTKQRWVRVTDDQELNQLIPINKMGTDEYGRPSIVNQIGSLDVDIILDEGPDAINMMADNYAVLQSLGPAFAQEFPELAIELSPLTGSVKKKMLDTIKQKQANPQPDPKVAAMQAQFQLEQQSSMATMQLDQQRAAQEMQIKRDTAAMEMEIDNRRLAANIEREQTKAAAMIQIEHGKAVAKAQTDMAVAEHQAKLSTAKAANDAANSNRLAAAKAKQPKRSAPGKP